MPILAPLSSESVEGSSPLHALINALIRVSRSVLLQPDTLSPLSDMPVAQLRCLNAVARQEGRKMQEVARELGIKLPAMSQIVERLVQREMLERRADPRDRRVTRLHLTQGAQTLLSETQARRERHLSLALARIDPEVVDSLQMNLTRLAEATEQTVGLLNRMPTLPLEREDSMTERAHK